VSAAVWIHLRIRVRPEHMGDFLAFLGEAIPCYERPGGIRVRLLRCDSEPGRFIEVVEYASEADFRRDQERVEHDPEMKVFLSRWRALLDGPPEVEVYREGAVGPSRPWP
jgi:quinol monooxygenase YgiN